MFCSRCGSQISEDLNFCSRCGERVNKNELAESSKKQNEMLDNLAITAICIGGGGMLFFVGLIAVLLNKDVNPQLMALIAVLYIGAWFGILLKLLKQISKIVDANLEDRKLQKAEINQPAQLAAPTTAQLEEHREPVMSITENTTRTLEEIPLKQH